MELVSKKNRSEKEATLQRQDWIVAGLTVLLDEGVEAVQIARLARELKVTRGSFYWHFEKREDLLSALLDEWSARNTGKMVEILEEAQSLEQGILELFFIWVDHTHFNPDLDQAVRDWGRFDPAVREIFSGEDDDRIEAIARFLRGQGFEEKEAFVRARIIYFTQVSYFALRVSETIEERVGYLSAYFLSFTGKEINAGTAERFRQRMLKWAQEKS